MNLRSALGELEESVRQGDADLSRRIGELWQVVYSAPLSEVRSRGYKLIEEANLLAGGKGHYPFASAGGVRGYAYKVQGILDIVDE